MATSEQRPNSPAVPAATTPTTAQATPVADPSPHPPSSSAQLQPANLAQQIASSGDRTHGQVTGTRAPPAPASTSRELRPRPGPQLASGRAQATPDDSRSAAASNLKGASKKAQTPRNHRTANAKRVTKPVPGRETAKVSRDGVLKPETSHGRGGGTPSTSVRRMRSNWDAPREPSQHNVLTRSHGSVTGTYQQMEVEAEKAIRRVNERRRARRREREEEKEEGRSGEGSGGKRARVQQVMNPRN